MSILIKGLHMPDCCWNCPCIDGEYGQCNISGKTIRSDKGRLADCPLIELPPDHGDLIDRDELIGEMKHVFGEETIVTFTRKMKGFKSTIKTWPGEPMFEQQCNLTEFVRLSPVIISAERSE